MISINMPSAQTVSLKKAESTVDVDIDAMPEASKVHVFQYGLRQILNDAMASAKTVAEAKGMTQKRLDNLMSGTLRASPVREGDPIRKRALELAEAKIRVNPVFIKWAQAAGVKISAKPAIAKLRELAKQAVDKEGNIFIAQAKIDVAAAKDMDIGELEIDI